MVSKSPISKPSISKFGSVTLALIVISASLTSAQSAQTGDAQKGQTLFKDKCSHCHSDQQGVNHRGPSLYGVVGRPAGQVPDYKYSSAMKSSGKTWDPATLSQFLAGPKDLVPGTKMSLRPIKEEQDRADIIAYLATQHQ